MDNEVVKNRKSNTPGTKVNNLERRIPAAITLIHINQYNTDKHNLEKKIGAVDKIIPDISSLVTRNVSNAKISQAENKMPDTSSLVLFLIQILEKLKTKFLIMVNILLLKV